MRKLLPYSITAALLLCGIAHLSIAQDKGDDADDKRKDVFGKSFGEKVEEAVDKGCDWLKKQQGIEKGEDPAVFGEFRQQPTYGAGEPHRYRFARTAFPIQALCKSGVFADEPEIVKAMNYLRKHYKEEGVIQSLAGNVSSSTYEDATVINAVEAYYISAWEAKDRGLDNIKKRQKDGIKRWGTEEKGAKEAKKKKKERNFKLSKEDQKICELAVKALEARARKAYGAQGWRYQPSGRGENQPDVDISATQYALLGFKCASRLGIRYNKSILMDAFHLFRTWQDKDGPEVVRKAKDADGKAVEEPEDKEPKKDPNKGTRVYRPKQKDKARGWSYCRKDHHAERDLTTCGSMTAAAICGLVILRDEVETDPAMKQRWSKVEDDCDQMISDGLAWLVVNWTMAENPKLGTYRYLYYLYTMERLGMLGGVDYIDKYDWYMEGADQLLKLQQDNGMWYTKTEIEPGDIYDTCYALLFLKRAEEGIDRPKPVFTGEED